MSDLVLYNSIKKLYPGAEFALSGDNVTFWKHTEELDMNKVTTDILSGEKLISSKRVLKNDILSLVNKLTKKSKELISGKYVDALQRERYDAKREAILANNIDYFKEEASLISEDPQVLFDRAKRISTAENVAINTILGKIDAIRIKLNSMLSPANTIAELDPIKKEVEFYINKLNTTNIEPSTDLLILFNTLGSEYKKYITTKDTTSNTNVV